MTADNFARAESDMYIAKNVKDYNNLGKFYHIRTIASVDSQPVVRFNRDVLVSMAVFDMDAGPVTITVPDPGKRFFSILVINQDHYNPLAAFGGGTYQLTKQSVGTRYAQVALRLLADPDDPGDMDAAHALQDKVTVTQTSGPGKLVMPKWDTASQDHIRDSLLAVARTTVDFPKAFGTKEEVDPAQHLIVTAAGWGGNPPTVAIYKNFAPPKNDGITKYKLHVPANVPVDAFWSVSVYNAKGYFEKNAMNVYNLNSITANKNKDGSVDILFGDCNEHIPNCIPIMSGWSYTVRLYRPHASLIAGEWKFPEPQEVSGK